MVATSLIKGLFSCPYQFSYLQVHKIFSVLQKTYPQFSFSYAQSLRMDWSPSEISKISLYDHDRRPLDIDTFLRDPNQGHGIVEVQWMALVGLQGPLPLIDHERVLRQVQDKKFALKEFLDIFHHRFLSLYAEIEKKSYSTLNIEPPSRNLWTRFCQQIMGYDKRPIAATSLNISAYAELFWQKHPNAWGLKTVLNQGLGWKVLRLKTQGQWHPLPRSSRSQISHATLGGDQALGKRCWVDFTRLILTVCPHNDFTHWLPHDPNWARAQALIQSYGPQGFSYDIHLQINRQITCVLTQNLSIRLGWTSQLTGQSNKDVDRFILLRNSSSQPEFAKDSQSLLVPAEHPEDGHNAKKTECCPH